MLCTAVAPKGSNFRSGIAAHAQFLCRQRNGGTGRIYDTAERGDHGGSFVPVKFALVKMAALKIAPVRSAPLKFDSTSQIDLRQIQPRRLHKIQDASPSLV